MMSAVNSAISTHAPLTRRDKTAEKAAQKPTISTHAPLTRRDEVYAENATLVKISTHAPLTRRDTFNVHISSVSSHFYSRASYEARRPFVAFREV